MSELELGLEQGPDSAYRARKFAGVAVELSRAEARFQGWGDVTPSAAETLLPAGTEAGQFCGARSCTCGFHGARRVDTLLDLLAPTLADLSGAAVLDVELHGDAGRSEFGLRARGQRVLGAQLLRWCADCVADEIVEAEPPALYAVPTADAQSLVHGLAVLCGHHAATRGVAVPVRLADLAGWLGVEVTWATPDLMDGIRGRIERAWAPPQLLGPLAEQRRVSNLRMGQVGFVRPSAVRMDEAGHLWVDADAMAPQRPDGAASVPIKRDVDLRLELVASADGVARWDARWSRPRRVLPATKEAPIARIRGLRHLPRVANTWARY